MMITKTDYFEFSGIDLDQDFKKSESDNPSKAVNIFLTRVENWCINYLKVHYFWDGDTDDLEADELAYYKQGLLHQVDYVRKHGDVSLSLDKEVPELAPNAKIQFRLAGLMNANYGRW